MQNSCSCIMSWSGKCFDLFYKYKRKTIINVIKVHRRSTSTEPAPVCSEENIQKLKILFFGTDNFSLPSLTALHEVKRNAANTLVAVTSFKNPANCVRSYAQQQQLPVQCWPVEAEFCRQYDLGVVVSFGHLIPEHIINAFPLGMINVHASLLPRWRGAAPIIYALMHGDSETGVSIMKIAPKHFDIGDILAQRKVAIKPNILMPDLHAELSEVGSKLLIEVLRQFPKYLENARKQDNAEATFAPKITKAITEANWSTLNAQQLHNRFRALYGFKCLTTNFSGKSVQLVDLQLPVSALRGKLPTAGAFVYRRERKCLLVECANKTQIEVHQLRLEGKKLMSASDFNNGFLRKLKVTDLLFTNKSESC